VNEAYLLWATTGIALIVSLVASRQKTVQALRLSLKRLMGIAPHFLIMMLLVSIVLYFVSDEMIAHYLGKENKYTAVIFASIIGSITFIPGFIAFPLAGLLLSRGVPYMVLAAFTTTLMMVGVVTYPIEKAYLGTKTTVVRNGISFLIALAVAAVMGILYGEIP
jgi:uncharacterized membrane protein YraQ (UPF0718 family)